MAKSVETDVKQMFDPIIQKLGWSIIASENQTLDESIDKSLRNNPSKQGGNGGGRPDYSLLLSYDDVFVPVMVEYKGTRNRLVSKDKQGLVILRNDVGAFDYHKSIALYAVNGAVYYAMNVVRDTDYQQALAVGVNGVRDTSGQLNIEISAYVVNKKDPELPIFVGNYSSLEFLARTNVEHLFQTIERVQADPIELEQRSLRDDAKIEAVLQDLNQHIHDEHQIIPSQRINIVAGCLMAAVGVRDNEGGFTVSRLQPSELVGSTEEGNTDGEKIMTKVSNFLKKRHIPPNKQRQIINVLRTNFVDNNLNQRTPTQTQTPLKTIYSEVAGYPKKDEQGKGYSSYFNTVLMLAFHRYLRERGSPHYPGVLVIDSPLKGFDQGRAEAAGSMRGGLFTYLTQESAHQQIIILDNTDKVPGVDRYLMGNLIEFTKDRDTEKGHYGYLKDFFDVAEEEDTQ